eukprot:899115-Pyramimonas_sp.AAC.1
MYVSALEVLGIEVGSGRPRTRARVRGAARRTPRARAVRKAGPLVSRFAKQALPSRMEHGLGIHRATPSLVAQMRAAQR